MAFTKMKVNEIVTTKAATKIKASIIVAVGVK